MEEIMWIMKWEEELQLAASLLTPIFLLFLAFGVFSVARQLKKANRALCSKTIQKTVADKPTAAAPKTGSAAAESICHTDEEDSRLIAGVLQEIFP